ncbi:MAG TPA: PTS fructose transporter subunit IIB [Phycisphaerales bacterium]|nr:PTS fructose transporter subunit IIB [Phycisphaerales bacterium]
MKYIAVTACPTGIAHTYMAAENLEKTAKELGHEIKVETQGAMGIENELSAGDIESADVLILAADIMIEKSERFDGLPTIEAPVQLALKDPKSIFSRTPRLRKR